MKKPKGYWTFERCKKEARKYTSRKAFQLGSKVAYQKSFRKKWLNSICSHMNQLKNPSNFWSNEKIQACANKCKTRREMGKRYSVAYAQACKLGILDEIFKNHKNFGYKRMPYFCRSKEYCKKIALKYKNKKAFKLGDPAIYGQCQKLKWTNEVCSHMPLVGNRFKKEVYIIINENEKKVYVGYSKNHLKRFEEHKNTGLQYVKNLIKSGAELKLISEMLPLEEACKLERKKQIEYKSLGYTVVNKKTCGTVSYRGKKHDKKKTLSLVKKYKSRKDLFGKNPYLYRVLVHNKWLEEAFMGHENSGRYTAKCPMGMLRQIVKKYKFRQDFKKSEPQAYQKARGKLNELFKNHENKGYKKLYYSRPDNLYLYEMAKKHKTRKAIYTKFRGIYNIALKKNLWNKIFESLPNKGYQKPPTSPL